MPYLFLLFILMPIIEIAVLIRVGGALGLLPTLLIVILTAVIGTHMLRQQGRVTLERARSRLGSGQMPASEIVEGLLLLVGGVLLLTPGFVTDAFGFACLIPVSRRWLAARLSQRSIGVVIGGFGAPGTPGGPTSPDADPSPGPRVDPQAGSRVDPRTAGTRRATVGDGAPAPGAATGAGTPGDGRGRDGGEVIEGDYRRVD